MTAYFRRQLEDYVEYHRDPWNCMAHVLGIVTLFLGAILPLTIWKFPAFGSDVTLAMVLAAPVLIYWLILDPVLGLAIFCAAALLLAVASVVVAAVSLPVVLALSGVLIAIGISAQVVGHKIFERRKPSMADHPTHFLLGPPFVMAKLFIALGFRHDLAAIIGPVPASCNR